VAIGNRTIGPFRGLEADEVVHGGRPGLRIDCPIGSNVKARGLRFSQRGAEVRMRCAVSAPVSGSVSERIPGRALGELQVAHIDSKTRAEAGADRNHDDVVGVQRRKAEPADKICRSVNAAESAEN
jgi:hypothetical protein